MAHTDEDAQNIMANEQDRIKELREVAWIDPDHNEGWTPSDRYTKDLEEMLRKFIAYVDTSWVSPPHGQTVMAEEAKALLERTD